MPIKKVSHYLIIRYREACVLVWLAMTRRSWRGGGILTVTSASHGYYVLIELFQFDDRTAGRAGGRHTG